MRAISLKMGTCCDWKRESSKSKPKQNGACHKTKTTSLKMLQCSEELQGTAEFGNYPLPYHWPLLHYTFVDIWVSVYIKVFISAALNPHLSAMVHVLTATVQNPWSTLCHLNLLHWLMLMWPLLFHFLHSCYLGLGFMLLAATDARLCV